jgi:hypothetical protein
VQQAQQEMETNHAKLRVENETLKARVKLLEEGQSKDLTLLVGQKVDESQEITGEEFEAKSKILLKDVVLEKTSYPEAVFLVVCDPSMNEM